MLSYVIPQEAAATNGRNGSGNGSVVGSNAASASAIHVPSSPRNLSLNLNSQYLIDAEREQHHSIEAADVLLANVAGGDSSHSMHETCDEHTHLLRNDDCRSSNTPTPKVNRQNSNGSNNNNSTNCNRSSSVYVMGGGGDDVVNVNLVVGSIDDDDNDDDEMPTHDGVICVQETTTANDPNSSDKQQYQQQNPRQAITAAAKKPKLSKLGSNKTVGLKRVSFGSSKGSMVETLVFETPTPLSEHVEPHFGFGSEGGDYSRAANMDDSGIEVHEESERSIVRVSIYQSSQPQQICPPDYFTKFEDNLDNTLSNYNCNLEDIMTAASPIPGYDRQQSTDSGWDNPFRPGGDLSREADEIVKMISGGKPITPTEEHAIGNGKSQANGTGNGTVVTEEVTKSNVTQNQSAQNGTNGSHRVQTTTATTGGDGKGSIGTNGVSSSAQVSKQVVPGPTSASHVVIDEKKNKKKGCCVVQ